MTNPVQGLSIGSTVLGVDNIARASAFWMTALDYVLREEPDDTWAVLVPRRGRDAAGARVERKRPSRTTRATTSTSTQPIPPGRSSDWSGLGARRFEDWDGYRADSDFTVLEDTSATAFCVIDKSGVLPTGPSDAHAE